MIGWAISLACISEVPFLLFADRILQKLGTNPTLLASAAVAALRWLLFYLVRDPYLVLPLQILHGGMYIVMFYATAVYINREIPRELKASGQTLFGAVSGSLARIIGLVLGTALGIRQVFLYSSLLVLAAAAAFGIYCARQRKSAGQAASAASGNDFVL